VVCIKLHLPNMKALIDDLKFPNIVNITGSTRAGKSVLTRKIMEQYKYFWDYIYICCPTMKASSDWKDWKDNSTQDEYPKIKHFTDPSTIEGHMREIYRQAKDVKESFQSDEMKQIRQYQEPPQICIVLDDLAETNLLRFGSFLDKQSISTRHWNITLIVLAQRTCGTGRNLRLNSAYHIAFNCANFSELERITIERVPKKYRKEFEDKLEQIYSEPYNFMMFDAFNPNIKERLWKNGTELIRLG